MTDPAQPAAERFECRRNGVRIGHCLGLQPHLHGESRTHTQSFTHPAAAGVNIPEKLEGCHTVFIDKYVVDGHVPLKTLDKLLTERPDIRRISLPGMPNGSPGMTGQKTEPFTIYEIGSDAEPRVYATE